MCEGWGFPFQFAAEILTILGLNMFLESSNTGIPQVVFNDTLRRAFWEAVRAPHDAPRGLVSGEQDG